MDFSTYATNVNYIRLSSVLGRSRKLNHKKICSPVDMQTYTGPGVDYERTVYA